MTRSAWTSSPRRSGTAAANRPPQVTICASHLTIYCQLRVKESGGASVQRGRADPCSKKRQVKITLKNPTENSTNNCSKLGENLFGFWFDSDSKLDLKLDSKQDLKLDSKPFFFSETGFPHVEHLIVCILFSVN